ncbi:MAG: RND family transporter, partial [Candidatus Binatia bacterium]
NTVGFEADGVHFYRVGGPVEFVVAGEELNSATLRIVPVMVALVGLTLFALFRSVTVAAAALLTVGVAVLWTLGALGWIGWAQNSLSQTLAPLILVIGVCDGIHLISSYAHECAAHPPRGIGERRAALERVSADVGTPCVMTSLTTAAGFLSFATADLRSFVDYGIIAAIGVMFALVLSFSFLPLLLLRVQPERIYVSRASAVWERGLARLVTFADNRRQVILACSVVLGIVCSLGMARLRVDSSFEELYGTQSRVVRWAHFASRHLRKPDALEVDLQLPPDAALEAPATLAGIGRIAHDLSGIAPLGKAHTVLDLLAQTRRLAFGEAAGGDGAAADAEENAALLGLASEMGSGRLSRWVDAAHRHVRISIASEKLPQDVLRRVMAQVRRYLHALPPGWRGTATGPLALVSDMLDAIRTTQLRSFAAAAAAVAALLALYLRSITWTALALFPTALPVVVTLGVMGWMNLPLDIGSAMVAAVVLGIAVDDIIHLLHHIRCSRRAGQPLDLAVRTTIRRVGQPVVTTSVALTIGFAALILSPWRSVASFGLVSAIAIAGALVADLLVLPALMFVMAGTSHTRAA